VDFRDLLIMLDPKVKEPIRVYQHGIVKLREIPGRGGPPAPVGIFPR